MVLLNGLSSLRYLCVSMLLCAHLCMYVWSMVWALWGIFVFPCCYVHICICMCGHFCVYCTTRKHGCLADYLWWFVPIRFLKEQKQQWCTGQSIVKSCLCSTRQVDFVCWRLLVPYYMVKWVQKLKPDDPEHCSLWCYHWPHLYVSVVSLAQWPVFFLSR